MLVPIDELGYNEPSKSNSVAPLAYLGQVAGAVIGLAVRLVAKRARGDGFHRRLFDGELQIQKLLAIILYQLWLIVGEAGKDVEDAVLV